jgi:TonB-linked SusC/RagA family outer membrane protein
MKIFLCGRSIYTLNDRILKILKKLSVLVLLVLFSLNAFAKNPVEKTITLNLKNVSLINVVSQIEKQTNYLFVYDEQVIDMKKQVTIIVKDSKVEAVLNKILEATNIEFKIDGKNIVLKKKSTNISSKSSNKITHITGVVLDEKGETIIGASVLETGTKNGTVTNLNGKFSIDISNSALLTISYIGYTTLEMEVDDKQSIVAVLRDNEKKLEEVVVVGFGYQKKESVVGAISSVRAADIIQTPVANISNALNGRLPGLIAMQRQGEPGRDDAEIYIRGKSTLEGAAATPLVLVDGVERSFTELDANEIETISILKDASATAVYGVRGANGVILVTTKRGAEGPAKIQFSSQVGFQNPTRSPKFRDAQLTAELYQEGYYNDNKNADGTGKLFYSNNQLAAIARSVLGTATPDEKLLYPNNNWFDELTQSNAPQQQYNLNISGGNKAIKYFISGGYLSQGSYFKDLSSQYYVGQKNYDSNFKFDRYNFRSNVDVNVTKDFTATLNLSGRLEKINSPNVSTQALYSYLYGMTSLLSPIAYPGIGFAELPNSDNPAALLTQNGFQNQTKSNIESSIILKYNLDFITKGLKARANVSFDSQFSYTAVYWEGYDTYKRDWSNTDQAVYQQAKKGSALSFTSNTYWNTNKQYEEFGLDYNRTFGKHTVTGLVLYNQQEYRNGAITPYVYQGLVGRTTYSYDKKYLGEVNIGYNGSENFASGKRFGFFPAVSLGWVVSEEKFMKKLDFISFMKVRGSYGEVGNDKLYIGGVEQRFLYYNDYAQSGGYRFGSNYLLWNGIMEGRIGNNDVTWERAKKSNIGVEANFFNSKLGLVMDLFNEDRSNILISQANTVPKTGGAQLPAANKGITNNHGFEVELTHRSKIGEFNYFVKGNYTFARNKIISIDEPTSIASWQRQEGKPIGQPIMYECIGLFQSVADIASSPSQAAIGVPMVGDRKYRDYNGDGVINTLDRFASGYSNIPEISYGFSFGGSIKGFDFSVLLQGVDHVSLTFWKGQNNNEVGRWNPFLTAEQNTNAAYPTLHSNAGSGGALNNGVTSSGLFGNVYNGAYLKLKNVEIGYSLPKSWVKSIGISSARIYTNGVNLAILMDHLKYLDPEAGSGDGTFYPQMRVINCGFNITF